MQEKLKEFQRRIDLVEDSLQTKAGFSVWNARNIALTSPDSDVPITQPYQNSAEEDSEPALARVHLGNDQQVWTLQVQGIHELLNHGMDCIITMCNMKVTPRQSGTL
jgi:hypothetical protein